MRVLAATLAAAGLAAAASPAFADTFRVPSPGYDKIQDAVDAAGDGDTVLVAPGDYAEEVSVTSKSNLRIRGIGKPRILPAGVAFTITDGSVVSITGFLVEGGAGGVLATASSGVVISKVDVVGSTDESFAFEGCAGVLLTRCRAFPTDSEAVIDLSSTGLVIQKCEFEPTGSFVVLDLSSQVVGAAGSDGAVVAKNRITGGGTAIQFSGKSARIEKNTVSSAAVAILLTGANDTTGTAVSRNRVTTFGLDGIESHGPGVVLERNRLFNGGIDSQGDAVVLDRNVIYAAPNAGIDSAGDGVTVTRNRVYGSSAAGLYLGGGVQTVAGNKVYEPDQVGIYLIAGTAGSSLEGNLVIGSDTYGIVVYDTPVAVTGNRSILNGLADYADSSAEGVNVLVGNRFATAIFNFMD